MDYNTLYDSFGKGRKADTKRAMYWRQYEPYCFLIDEDHKVAYPINRFYKKIGQPRETEYIYYPHHTRMQWLYKDGKQPYFSKSDCSTYSQVVKDIYTKYQVKDFDEKQLASKHEINNWFKKLIK